ncbi:MAG: sensor histidine kinase, partial [Bacteroidetes bacterium]
VHDTGIGIPPNMIETLFSNGLQHNRTGTAGEVSYGLGLPIAKDIVEAHNGKIWVESNSQMGTTFYVQLPLQKFS